MDPSAGRARLRTRISAADFDEPVVQKPKPRRGWRRFVYSMGIHVKPSATEVLENQQIRKIKAPVREPFVVTVLNHKSSAKTTSTVSIGSTLAKYRGEGKVFVIDADVAFGNLMERISLPAASSFRDLLAVDAPNNATLRQHVGMTGSGLWAIGGELNPGPDARPMTPQDLKALVELAKVWFEVILIDCTNDLRTPMVAAAVAEANAVIVPAAMRLDSVLGALTTLDWLEAHGYSELVRQALVVLSDVYNEGGTKVAKRMESKFGTTVRAIRSIEYDPHIAKAGPIELDQLTLKSRLALTDVGALLAELFAAAADRGGAQRPAAQMQPAAAPHPTVEGGRP